MPFQSSKSLKAARPLTSRAAQNIANQNHPAPQNQAQNASTWTQRGACGICGELCDGNFSTVSPSRTMPISSRASFSM